MESTIKTRSHRLLSFICTLVMLFGIGGFFGIKGIDASAAQFKTLNCGPASKSVTVAVPNGVTKAVTIGSFVRAYKSGNVYNVYIDADKDAARTYNATRSATIYFKDKNNNTLLTYTIYQTRNYLRSSSTSARLNNSINTNNYYQFTLDYNCRYKITCDSFLTVKSISGLTENYGGSDYTTTSKGSRTLRIYPKTANKTGRARTGYIKIRKDGSYSDTITIYVTQNP